ncbi:MAG: energy transducer TonB, partial [Gemmatimonadota bacterium]
PRLAEPVEEEVPETVAEDEPAEKVPDPDVAEPAPRRVEPRGREPTPRPGPDRGERVGPGLPVSLEGRPFAYPWYLETLVGKIGRNWRPTGSAALSATVHFRIDSRGRLLEIELAEGSGNLVFDRSALRAVQASDPMPPLPAGYDGDYLGVYFVFDAAVRDAQQ